MSHFLNTVDIVRLIVKWRKHLLAIASITILLSTIFSGPYFIKPRFKSFAILYPSNLTAYSSETPTEQMLQLLQSADIRDKIIDVFHLKKHYNIDTINNYHQISDVIKAYEENVQIKQTEYESVEIIVMDESPMVASNMVDSIIAYFNQKTRTLQRSKSHEVVLLYQSLFVDKERELDSLDNLLKEYRTKYGLLDYKAQAKEYSRAYLRALTDGKSKAIETAKELLAALANKGGEFNALSERMDNGLSTYSRLQTEYENALKDVTKELTYSNVVTKPVPADKKSYPIRWLIVIVSVLSALFITFMTLLFMDSARHFELSKKE